MAIYPAFYAREAVATINRFPLLRFFAFRIGEGEGAVRLHRTRQEGVVNGLTPRSAAYQRAREGESLREWIARTEANAARLEARTHYVYSVFDE